jgi:hypothetical protein
MYFRYSMYKYSDAVRVYDCQNSPIPGAERIVARETREGWPLLTIETESNWALWSTNERGPSLVGSFGSSCQYKRFFILP